MSLRGSIAGFSIIEIVEIRILDAYASSFSAAAVIIAVHWLRGAKSTDAGEHRVHRIGIHGFSTKRAIHRPFFPQFSSLSLHCAGEEDASAATCQLLFSPSLPSSVQVRALRASIACCAYTMCTSRALHPTSRSRDLTSPRPFHANVAVTPPDPGTDD